MSSPVSRRTIAKGAAWSIPVVAVGAAAPMAAASVCPTIVSMSGTHSNGSGTSLVTISFASDGDTYCITSISALGGRNGGVSVSYSGAATGGSNCGTGTVQVTASVSDNGSNVRGSYSGTVTFRTPTGFECTVPVDFSIS